MISYAQNAEDVVLARAFAGLVAGFYVDLGASDPILDSVTKAFYDMGWSGVNVEPLAAAHAALVAERSRDVNLQLAIGRPATSRTFYEAVNAPGLSTLDARRVDYAHAQSRLVERRIEVIALRDLFTQYVGDRTVDFLKIDVEGLEDEVVSSGEWSRFRPRVLVIEGDPQRVGAVLGEARYRQTLWDGINSFWVREEDAEALAPALSRPAVAVLDGYDSWHNVVMLRDAIHALAQCRLRKHGFTKEDHQAIHAVAETYASRIDLRAALGNPMDLDVYGLLRWASRASHYGDPAAARLAPYKDNLSRLAGARGLVSRPRRLVRRGRRYVKRRTTQRR